MNVIGFDSGRVTLLLDILELSPSAGLYAVELIAAIREKYQFAVLPKLPTQDTQPQQVLRFEHGRSNSGYISAFEIHPQGLVVQSVDTRVCDEFLDDIFAIGAEQFGIRQPSQHARKLYASGFVAEFENDIAGLISKWKNLSALANSYLQRLYELDVTIDLTRISLRPDPERLPHRIVGLLADFTLERRVYVPYSSQRFYSTAPLPTDQHIEFLKALDALALPGV